MGERAHWMVRIERGTVKFCAIKPAFSPRVLDQKAGRDHNKPLREREIKYNNHNGAEKKQTRQGVSSVSPDKVKTKTPNLSL